MFGEENLVLPNIMLDSSADNFHALKDRRSGVSGSNVSQQDWFNLLNIDIWQEKTNVFIGFGKNAYSLRHA